MKVSVFAIRLAHGSMFDHPDNLVLFSHLNKVKKSCMLYGYKSLTKDRYELIKYSIE